MFIAGQTNQSFGVLAQLLFGGRALTRLGMLGDTQLHLRDQAAKVLISSARLHQKRQVLSFEFRISGSCVLPPASFFWQLATGNWQLRGDFSSNKPTQRSEERRVGKECRSRWSPYH